MPPSLYPLTPEKMRELGLRLNLVDMGYSPEEKATRIALFKSLPTYNSSDSILLEESDIPPHLEGLVRFRKARNTTSTRSEPHRPLSFQERRGE